MIPDPLPNDDSGILDGTTQGVAPGRYRILTVENRRLLPSGPHARFRAINLSRIMSFW